MGWKWNVKCQTGCAFANDTVAKILKKCPPEALQNLPEGIFLLICSVRVCISYKYILCPVKAREPDGLLRLKCFLPEMVFETFESESLFVSGFLHLYLVLTPHFFAGRRQKRILERVLFFHFSVMPSKIPAREPRTLSSGRGVPSKSSYSYLSVRMRRTDSSIRLSGISPF